MKRLRAWAGTHQKQARLLVYAAVLLVLVLVGARMLSIFFEVRNADDSFTALDMDAMEVSGYQVEGNAYTLDDSAGKAYLRFEGLDRQATNLMVYFAEPVEQALTVQVRYEESFPDGYVRQQLTHKSMRAGDQSIEFLIGKTRLTGLDVTIGAEEGDSFALWEVLTKPTRKSREAMLELFFWCAFLACFAAVCVMVFLSRRRAPLHWLYVAVAGILGLVMMFALTPLSGPDEEYHYRSTLQVVDVLTRGGGVIDAEYYNFDGLIAHENTQYGYFRIMEDLFRAQPDLGETNLSTRNHSPYKLQFLPQAVGASIGKLAGLNFLGLFYLGRFTNLLFFLGCMCLAIRKVKRGKQLFFLVGILPLTLQQAASYSYDCFINGVALLLLAYILSAIYEDRSRLPLRELVIMWLLSVLLAPVKVIYIFLPLLLMLVPRERFASRWVFWGYLASILAAGALLLAFSNYTSLSGHVEAQGVVAGNGQQSYTLTYMLHYPVKTLIIFLRTIEELLGIYFTGAMGRHLSGMTMLLPEISFYVWTLLLFVTAMPRREEDRWIPTCGHRWMMGGVILAVLLAAMLAMFVAWTPGNAKTIVGVQGRYFMPLLPLAYFLLRNRRLTWFQKPPRALLTCGVLITCYSILYLVRYTVGWN